MKIFLVISFVLVSFVLPPQLQAQGRVVPPSGLVGWWPGDDNADDIQDGNPGTLVGGATFAAGNVGPAFSLAGAGSGNAVRIGDVLDGVFAGPDKKFTIDFWVNPTTFSNVALVAKLLSLAK